MSLLNQLYSASFNGVEFLMSGSDMTLSRKTVTHEYPNKKYRYVEDMGENLKAFEVRAVITGNNFLVRREALIVALQIKGIGVLVHPFYGVLSVVVKKYTVSEEMTRIGECIFTITFEEAYSNIFPQFLGINLSGFDDMAEQIAGQTADYLKDNISTSFQRNISDLGNKMGGLTQNLNSVVEPVNTENNALNDFNLANTSYNSNRYALIEDTTNLGSDTKNLFDSFNYLAKDSTSGYKLNSKVYYFGDDDTVINPITPQSKERLSNRITYNSCINCFILLNLFDNALAITYLDDQQLDQITSDLEEKYQYLMSNNNLPRDIVIALEKLRATARKYFEQLNVNISKVISVDSPTLPLSVLLYQLYDGFDNESEIVSLNSLKDSTVMNGNIKVLAGGGG